MGIRYVNLIIAENSRPLKDYLSNWALPAEPPKPQLSTLEGAYVARYKTGIGELRLQSLRNPQFTLPPELQSPLIVKNGWIWNRPSTDFALIDIDHCTIFSQPANMKTKDAIKHLKDLHGISKEVFVSIGTEFAHKNWS
ncbi:MAG: TIGR04255 family protein [Verrucomicrobia bacterium]|nr:TIGR04255 family protein [Verrucomicrobiota bacterium]